MNTYVVTWETGYGEWVSVIVAKDLDDLEKIFNETEKFSGKFDSHYYNILLVDTTVRGNHFSGGGSSG